MTAGEAVEDPGIVGRLGGKRLKPPFGRGPVAEENEDVGLLAAVVRVDRDRWRRLVEELPPLLRPAEKNLQFSGLQQCDWIGSMARMDGGVGRIERLFQEAKALSAVGKEEMGPLVVREEAGLSFE